MADALEKALSKVREARSETMREIESITGEIARLEDENLALPKQKASFGEIKKAVLDLVDAAGARHAETHIRSTIIDFAMGAYRDMAHLDKYGQTLTLGELDGAVKGNIFPMANTRFLSGGTGAIDDLMLYAVFSAAVKETLTRLIDMLSPADLGIHDNADVSGMTREEMNERIAANRAEIDRLKSRKAELDNELRKLS